MENIFKNNTIFDNDDYLFFKIILNNVDPLTGELLNLSQDSIARFRQILNRYCVKNNEYKNTTNELIINDYINGMDLNQLRDKYNITKKKLRIILKQTGYEKIRNTYYSTKILQKHNENYPNAGQRYTKEEDCQIERDYINGNTIQEISSKNKRTEGAIRSRLRYLGFATEDDLIEQQWPYYNKNAIIVNDSNYANLVDLNDLEHRIQNYLKRRKIQYDVNGEEYRKAKEKILFIRFNIKCEKII